MPIDCLLEMTSLLCVCAAMFYYFCRYHYWVSDTQCRHDTVCMHKRMREYVLCMCA